MKSKEEIEKAARIYENFKSESSEAEQCESVGRYYGYKKGYTQCQEDNDELYHKAYLQGREDMAFELSKENPNKKDELQIELEEWFHNCADGCCSTYGTNIYINGKQIENEDGTNAHQLLTAVLNQLGYKNVKVDYK